MSKPTLSRRDFLKLAGLAAGAMAFSPFLPGLTTEQNLPMVRVGTKSVSVHAIPSEEGRIVAQWYRDEILHVYEEVVTQAPLHNPVWYRVWGGYVHRSHLPQVQVRYQEPRFDIDPKGMVGEVTVPYTQSMRRLGDDRWQPIYRLYYGTIHWVVAIEEGPDGQPWYLLHDELLEIRYYIPAIHMRILPYEEYSPISPEVPHHHKRIEVSLAQQKVWAYEYGNIVFEATVATGLRSIATPKDAIPTYTPPGEYNILVKMPSKHMGDGSMASDIEAYELVGVPWSLFFTMQGHAFHGTYWHENFGTPMSRGCINMRNEDALWLYRWVLPIAPPEEFEVPQNVDRKGYGTRVIIY
jgi:hypothetical protein